MSTVWCSHAVRQVDRALCPHPCGAIHVRCTGCGAAVGGCPFESDGLHERLVAVLGAQLPCAEEWQVRDLAELVQRGGHADTPLPLSRALAMIGLPGDCRPTVELTGLGHDRP
jgi:ferredoxin